MPTCGEELSAMRCGRARAACGGSGSGVGRGKGKDRDCEYGGSGVDCLRAAAAGVWLGFHEWARPSCLGMYGHMGRPNFSCWLDN